MPSGRPTNLTKELLQQIKQSVLDGNTLRKTAEVCGLSEGVLYAWHGNNYLNLGDKIEGWRRDRKLLKAESNIEEMLEMDIRNTGVTKDGKQVYEYDDIGKLRVKAEITKFVAETLGKKHYSTRTEHTGVDGKDLPTPILIGLNVQSNHSNSKDTAVVQAHPSLSGRDVSLEDGVYLTVLNPPSAVG